MLLNRYLSLLLFSFKLNAEIYENYSGTIECNASSPVLHPESVEELQKIIKNAIKDGKRVKIIGSGHSNNDNICTDGIPVQIKAIKEASFNKTDGTTTVSAGFEFLDALDKMNEFGVTLPIIPTYGAITIGAAVSMGVTGSSLQAPNAVSSYLKALTIIDGHGNLITIDDTDKDFEALRVSLGQLGAIVSAKFKTVPKQKMKVVHKRESDKLLIKNPAEIVKNARNHLTYQIWWFPLSKSMVVHEGDVVPFETPGNAVTHLIPNVAPLITGSAIYSLEGFQAANSTALMHSVEMVSEARLHSYIPFQDPIFEENGKFVNPAVGLSYKLLMNYCKNCGWDPVISKDKRLVPSGVIAIIDIEQFPAVMAELNNLFTKFPTSFAMFGLFIRFGKSSPGVFSYGQHGDLAIFEIPYALRNDFYNEAPIQLQVLQSLMQLLIIKYKARPHWAFNEGIYYNNNIISERYDIGKFRQAVERFDPNGVFRNKYGNRILGVGQPQYDLPSKARRCALFGTCFCSKDSDCANMQKCGSLIGYNVCVSPKFPFLP